MRTLALFTRIAATWLLALESGLAPASPPVSLTIDAGSSHVLIDIGKAGAFSFAGHAHEVAAPEVRGTVTVDPLDWRQSAVSLEFNAAALRVTGAGEPAADVPKVQETMVSDRVLDAARFPSVVFRSRSIAIVGGATGAADLQIEGDLTLHGKTRPLSVRAKATMDGAGTLTSQGVFSLKQTDFGIEPVTAAGGTIRVKDAVDVRFVLVARR